MNTNRERKQPDYIAFRGEKVVSGIYKIIALESGNFYIGSAVNIAARWALHRHYLTKQSHHNKALQRAWNKYGEDGLSFQVIEHVSEHVQLVIREQYWMDTLKPTYNSRPLAASQLGFKHTDESKRKMGDAQRGRVKSPETIAKFRASMIGRKHTPEAIKTMTGLKRRPGTGAKISAANKGRVMSRESIAKMSATKRSQHLKCYTSPETRAKIAAAMLGNTHGLGHKKSDECKARISAAHKGKIISPEARLKMSISAFKRHARERELFQKQ